jgi:hypothetical protein
VPLDAAFVRSVNLRPVAWCRSCWFAKHGITPSIPEQRQPPAATRARRRWGVRAGADLSRPTR